MSAEDRELSPEDFAAFFQAVNAPAPGVAGPGPFLWQSRLVEQIWHDRRWPRLLDLPTGAGKTALIDIAVFLQALWPEAPRRVVFVVDRRVVVQQAFQRARRLARHLADHEGDEVLTAVARRLRDRAAPLGESDVAPLQCAELRGGIARDEGWAMRPDAPVVLVSTVDQVGSRLLFRGYGVSRSMRPVHAGLLGNDVLFLLDEVHLSEPFARTLRTLRNRYRPPSEGRLPDRWHIVEFSATPGVGADDDRFSLIDEDRDPQRSPVLHRRLSATKPVTTELVKVSKGDEAAARRTLAAAMVRVAGGLLESSPHVRTLAVVANRVDTAVAVHRALVQDGIGALLLTGRMRPFDRDDLLRSHVSRLLTGRKRSAADEPLVVVSTQAIEAGADFDFDGLVTECASLDALRQRLGRVDRDGGLAEAETPAPSVIVATSSQVAIGAVDPIYGPALAETWQWLGRVHHGEANFGPDALTLPPADHERAMLLAPKPAAPVVLPAYLDAWVQTSPTPVKDPDVSLWLHGLEHESLPDVNLVWRADLSEALLDSPGGQVSAEDIVRACPPASGEAMTVPLAAVLAWSQSRGEMMGAPAPDGDPHVADVEGGKAQPHARLAGTMRPVVVWRGADDANVVRSPRALQPGDTLVVPATYGGVSYGNWDPASTAPVRDHGLRAQVVQRRRAVLRLPSEAPVVGDEPPARHPLLADLPSGPDVHAVEDLNDGDPAPGISAWLAATAELPADRVGPHLRLVVDHLHQNRRWDVERLAIGAGKDDLMFVVAARRLLPAVLDDPDAGPETLAETVDSEPATSSLTGAAASLDTHLADVEKWARGLAEACDLNRELVEDLALAGRLHDLGKCDPRFQRYLRGGGLGAHHGHLLAKSGLRWTGGRADRQARWVAGYPSGTRHELLSQALVEDCGEIRQRATDWDLVLYLIASHHGHARPFVPVALDPAPMVVEHRLDDERLTASTDHGLARLDSGVPDRFWRLVRRYGWHGLAWLESILRLADHRASAQEHQSSVDEPQTAARKEIA